MPKNSTGNERVWNIMSEIDKVTSERGLEEIQAALNARRKDLQKYRARELYRKLNVGDRIVLATNMKPRYIGEATGTIVEIFTDERARKRIAQKATIILDQDLSYRRYSGQRVTVPVTAIMKRTARGKVDPE